MKLLRMVLCILHYDPCKFVLTDSGRKTKEHVLRMRNLGYGNAVSKASQIRSTSLHIKNCFILTLI
jgi:hypothetical protein